MRIQRWLNQLHFIQQKTAILRNQPIHPRIHRRLRQVVQHHTFRDDQPFSLQNDGVDLHAIG